MDSFTKSFSTAPAVESPLLGRSDFPFSCEIMQLDSFLGISIPWHWHNSFEFLLVDEGQLLCNSLCEQWICGPGDALFLNSGTLHTLHGNPAAPARFHMLSFDRQLLSGSLSSIYEQKYIAPVAEDATLTGLYFPANDPASKPVLSSLSRTIHDTEQAPFGFEFEIRSNLSRIWLVLMQTMETSRGSRSLLAIPEDNKLKAMIGFIQENFYRNITVQEIAAVGQVSERECFRCFKRMLGMSPITYLVDRRIRVAARMLRETDESIIRISSACGFSTSSYFDKTFKHLLDCTPREYRFTTRKQPLCP